MSKQQKNAPKTARNTTTTKPEATPAETPKKEKRARVRLASKTLDGFWVRAFKDIVDQFGMPKGPDGEPLHVVVARGGMSAEERSRRTAEKAAEKAKFDSMSDEDKLAFAKAKREANQAKRADKKQRERDELIAQIRAEIKAGTIEL